MPVTARYRQLLDALRRGFRIPDSCQLQHARLLRRRLRALAPVIAAATLAWIVIDTLGLQRAELAGILPLRLALAIALLQLARHASRLPAVTAARLFVWLQAVGFGAMQLCLDPEGGGALRAGYELAPLVLTAQMAVLPLPWGIALRLGLAPLALLWAPVLLGTAAPNLAFWNDLWLLGLILALAAWAGHVQLGLLIDLLGALRDATRDVLTGLDNRRSAMGRLESNRAHALRHGEPLSLLMIDLDKFKQVNDRWGHACGDLVLVATAQVLREELRGADLGARIGGEEFLALLPATGPVQATEVAERIRSRMARLTVPVSHNTVTDTITITASVGIATLQPAESVAALLARADTALYRAKAEGRNRCISAGDAARASTAIDNAPTA